MIRQGTVAYKAVALPGIALLHTAELVIGRLDANSSFYDPAHFAWIREIEPQWQTVRQEFGRLFPQVLPTAQHISEEQARITTGQQWKTYVFHAFGRQVTENCARCPETTRLLQRVPGMTTAMFSVLAPRAHIRAHRGVFKGVLRYHLPLVVPRPESLCGLRVGDESRSLSPDRHLRSFRMPSTRSPSGTSVSATSRIRRDPTPALTRLGPLSFRHSGCGRLVR
jgi:hypothetical protein